MKPRLSPETPPSVGAQTVVAPRNAGLDLLRILAMVIVVVQHGLTAVGRYDWTLITESGVSIGQFGVAIFCAVAGWFALGGKAPLGSWLVDRLTRLFPAYWLATLLAFALALAMARPITWGLFVSQMAGLGFFTHGWNLVNVVSWFVSLILLCYLLAATARLTAFPALAMAAFCAAAAFLVASETEVSLSRQVIAFAGAAVVRLSRRPAMLLGLAALLTPLLAIQDSFIYAIAALLALWVFGEQIKIESAVAALVAGYTYEVFLLHGIFLAGAAKLTSSGPWAIAIGVICSLPAAIVLKRLAADVAIGANTLRTALRA